MAGLLGTGGKKLLAGSESTGELVDKEDGEGAEEQDEDGEEEGNEDTQDHTRE